MIALYPGSFDPVTYGHMDIIERAARAFDKLIVAVLNNKNKKALFTVDERLAHLKKLTEAFNNVEIDQFSGLTADFAKTHGVGILVRGVRTNSDFEYECIMSNANKVLSGNIDTVFFPAGSKYIHVSSSAAREIAIFHGELKEFVPPLIEEELERMLRNN